MRKLVPLLLTLACVCPASALADHGNVPAPVGEPVTLPDHRPHIFMQMKPKCVTVPGAAQETTDPDGNPVYSECPKGQVVVQHGQAPPHKAAPPGHRKDASFGPAPEGGGETKTGYYYVEDMWENPKLTPSWKFNEAWYSYMISVPFFNQESKSFGNGYESFPEGEAHSDIQDWINQDNCNAYKAHTRCTLEVGWTREPNDQERNNNEGNTGGSHFFCYYTASDYAGHQEGDCPVSLNVPTDSRENIFRNNPIPYFAPSDGTPNSVCALPNGEKPKPCTAKFTLLVKQSKGAWWIGTNMFGFAFKWIGRVSNHTWGHLTSTGKCCTSPFTNADEIHVGGEVFDWPHPPYQPEAQMGNGNKGTCVCATQISALQDKRKLTTKEGGGETTEQQFFHNPLGNPLEKEGESYPTKYKSGNSTGGQSEMHLGG